MLERQEGIHIVHMLIDIEQMKLYRLDCPGLMCVVNLISDALASPTQHNNAITAVR